MTGAGNAEWLPAAVCCVYRLYIRRKQRSSRRHTTDIVTWDAAARWSTVGSRHWGLSSDDRGREIGVSCTFRYVWFCGCVVSVVVLRYVRSVILFFFLNPGFSKISIQIWINFYSGWMHPVAYVSNKYKQLSFATVLQRAILYTYNTTCFA
jgi:hypothetical protein